MSVEVGKQALALYRIGPFSTREEAENAFEILKSRSKTWSEEDEQDKS
jgi:cell division protein FtsN